MGRILIADDEQIIRELLEDSFSDWPHTQTACVQGCVQGAEKLLQHSFDLAVIDMGLPFASGLALADLAAARNTPVLLLCGDPSVTETLQAFGCPFVSKPFSISTLMMEARIALTEGSRNVARMQACSARLKQMPFAAAPPADTPAPRLS